MTTIMSVLSDKAAQAALVLSGYDYQTKNEPGEFTEGQKRYKNKLMSIRLEPFAKVIIENGNS